MGFLACDFMAAGGSRRRKNGHSVPLCNLGDHPWICWTHEGLVSDPFVVGASGKVQCCFACGVTQGPRRREAAYGNGLQYMSWYGWLGRMAQSRCRKVVDT